MSAPIRKLAFGAKSAEAVVLEGEMKRPLAACAILGSVGLPWSSALGCGGSSASLNASDAAVDALVADGPGLADGTTSESSSPVVDAPSGVGPDAAAAADSASGCAPPSDPTTAALCVSIQPEVVEFVATDPSFDGRGLLVVDVHDSADPNGSDGGERMALQSVSIPSADGGAGEFDLSAPAPVIRLDGLPPGVVYPRAIFVDSHDTKKVGAGWWIGNYNLDHGLRTPVRLLPLTLQAGTATSMTIRLIALRSLSVTLTRSATPLGNAQGAAAVVVTDDSIPNDASAIFGAASAPCVNLADASAVAVNGFVFGAGPYNALAVLNDFGLDADLAPGSLTSLVASDGGYTSPPSARLQYLPGAYQIGKTLDLATVVPYPGAGPDPLSCP